MLQERLGLLNSRSSGGLLFNLLGLLVSSQDLAFNQLSWIVDSSTRGVVYHLFMVVGFQNFKIPLNRRVWVGLSGTIVQKLFR